MGGTYGDVSLSDGVIEFAKTHEEMKGAFLTFQKDADQIYPGWKEKLGYTGESSVQAALRLEEEVSGGGFRRGELCRRNPQAERSGAPGWWGLRRCSRPVHVFPSVTDQARIHRGFGLLR